MNYIKGDFVIDKDMVWLNGNLDTILYNNTC